MPARLSTAGTQPILEGTLVQLHGANWSSHEKSSIQLALFKLISQL
jgi:hypothetical protein